MDKTYKKVEVEGEVFIEETTIRIRLIPISVFENKILDAQEKIDLKNEIKGE